MGGAGAASWWVQPLPEPRDPTAHPDLQGAPLGLHGVTPRGWICCTISCPEWGLPGQVQGGAGLQAPLSMGFSRQEYWSGLPFPSPKGSSQPRG